MSVLAAAVMVATLFVPPSLLPTGALAALSFFLFGARPLGAALGGFVGATWGEAACLWMALAAFGVQLGVILASPVSRLQVLQVKAAWTKF